MKKLWVIFLGMVAAVLSGCSSPEMQPSRAVEVEGHFCLDLPANMQPSAGLHEFAPLQYADKEGDFYWMGITEPKSKIDSLDLRYSLGDYAYFVESTLAAGYDTAYVSNRDTLEVNGLPCQTAELYAMQMRDGDSVQVYYHLAVYEGTDHFYQLIGWTHRERQPLLSAIAPSVDRSFQEFPGGSKEGQTAVRKP
ncbi:MAG: hypothetical protein U0176_02065 [Bacteroidia bacterium]